MKKQDVILILLVLVAAAVFFAGYRFWNRGAGEEVAVYVDETEVARFSLKDNREFLITYGNGEMNRLVIQDQKADITEASCPDKICVHQSAIERTGETIVCMPHKVVVTIERASQHH